MACIVAEFKFIERTLLDAHLQSENKFSVQLIERLGLTFTANGKRQK